MDENSDVEKELNKVIVLKNKQGSCVSKDNLDNSAHSIALLDLKFAVVSHL